MSALKAKPVSVSACVGAVVSSVKLLVPAALALPAVSVATALTLMLPSPKLARSLLLSTTAWALPVPIRVLLTVPLPPVNVTTVLAPLSALTVTTPLAAVASVLVAPSLTPLPKLKTGALGMATSRVKAVAALSLRRLPAASYNLTLTVPPAVMAACNSALVGVPSLVV